MLKNQFDPRKPQDRQLTMSSEEMKEKPLEYTAPLFLKECQMTADQVKRVEIETRGQSTNDLWHQQRIGRVTALNFHTYHTKAQSILNRKGQNVKKPVYSSLVSSLSSKSDDVSHLPQIKWGAAHEKDAIKDFMSDVASQHDSGLQGFKQCGLFIKSDYPYLAASPDGLFLCKCCGLSIVEAKCPYTVRNENIHVKDKFDQVDFLEDFHGKPRLKRSHKYYTQMQAQMWVCGVCHGFFIVWTQGGPPYYERVELDMEFCLNVVNNITLFYKSFVLPCLLGYRDIFDCPKCNKVILEADEISDSAKENSICCDTCGTWWHMPCADLTMSTADALDSWVCQSSALVSKVILA
ncbi:Exonuclease [Acropora cervicornis]|uniref:Exonuclease n=1 Tax=Acropora cervicornis TaxID=6130 RepID=A0AAD9Q1T9_ACRCE|nr:Exonuclease [Acropora cervicornis]